MEQCLAETSVQRLAVFTSWNILSQLLEARLFQSLALGDWSSLCFCWRLHDPCVANHVEWQLADLFLCARGKSFYHFKFTDRRLTAAKISGWPTGRLHLHICYAYRIHVLSRRRNPTTESSDWRFCNFF